MEIYFVHGRESCPFCVKALDLLSSFKGSLTYVARFYDESEKDILLTEQSRWNWKTVPVVTIVSENENGDKVEKLIGGYTDLCKHLEVDVDA